MAATLRMSAGSLSGAAAQQAAPRRAAAAMVPSARPFGGRLSAAVRSAPAMNARMTVTAAAVAETAPPSVQASTSDKYAIVEIGGTQMLVEEGRWYECNRLQAEPGSKIQLGRVIAHKDGEFTVGQPYLENVTVEAEILEELKGPKVLVYKMKPKKHYRRMKGHRQHLTKFKVTKISA